MRINLWYPKIHSVAWDQLRRWTSGFFFLLPRARRQIWKDQGGGLRKGIHIQGIYSETSSEVVDGVFTLHNFHAQVCDHYGKVQRM